MYYKKHSSGNGFVLAVSDKEVLGKELCEKDLCFRVREEFYKGNSVSEKELEGLLEGFSSANLVGAKAVGVALRKGLILNENVIVIQGVPHAQIYRV